VAEPSTGDAGTLVAFAVTLEQHPGTAIGIPPSLIGFVLLGGLAASGVDSHLLMLDFYAVRIWSGPLPEASGK